MYVFLCELCTCMFTRSYGMCASIYISKRVLKVCVWTLACVCECMFVCILGNCSCVSRRVEDGNKITLFVGLEWEQVAWETLCPLPIYFSVGILEFWTRLNRLALTKQHKINSGDWGYNNTQQPLLLSDSLLSAMLSGPHIKTRKEIDFFIITKSWRFLTLCDKEWACL